jgi:hypothetical protein
MILPRALRFLAVASAALLVSPAAHAVNQAVQQKWAQMDRCTKAALQRYPDNTPDNYAKRDALARQCQRESHLPPRQGVAPQGQTAPEPRTPQE